jgi:hypothetical protein
MATADQRTPDMQAEYAKALTLINKLREERDAALARVAALEAALRQLADNNLNEDNCAGAEVAGRRVAAIARAALGGAQ